MDIGNALKTIRKSKQLTQKQLADKVGISNTYLSEIENNSRRPSIDVIKTIADALQINFLYLIVKSLEKDDLKHENKLDLLHNVQSELDKFFV